MKTAAGRGVAAASGTVTLRDIAQDLQLSHSTVSRALAGHPAIKPETRLRVQARARVRG